MKKLSSFFYTLLFVLAGNGAFAQSTNQTQHFLNGLLATVIFALFGILLVVVAFTIVDKLTPGDLAHELTTNKNVALAIVYGSSILGISIIIAAAIAG